MLFSEYSELNKQNDLVKKELGKYREMDPDLFDARKAQLKQMNLDINRWTDNIFTLQSYCASKFNITKSDFSSQFGLPEELDYI